jgi:ubiquinone/menaquinone biosynthesis C-methylase UbiE
MTDYNNIGIHYNKTRAADIRIVDILYKLLEYPVNKRIIDVGAGTGNYANLLAEKGNRVIALEPSTEMKKQCTENENVEWIVGAAENINLDESIFDSAICILSIHHFSNPRKSFKEIFRVLKRNGILLLFTYMPEEQDYFWLRDYFPELFNADIKKFPAADTLEKLLLDCGFEISEVTKYELPYDLKDNFLAAN